MILGDILKYEQNNSVTSYRVDVSIPILYIPNELLYNPTEINYKEVLKLNHHVKYGDLLVILEAEKSATVTTLNSLNNSINKIVTLKYNDRVLKGQIKNIGIFNSEPFIIQLTVNFFDINHKENNLSEEQFQEIYTEIQNSNGPGSVSTEYTLEIPNDLEQNNFGDKLISVSDFNFNENIKLDNNKIIVSNKSTDEQLNNKIKKFGLINSIDKKILDNQMRFYGNFAHSIFVSSNTSMLFFITQDVLSSNNYSTNQTTKIVIENVLDLDLVQKGNESNAEIKINKSTLDCIVQCNYVVEKLYKDKNDKIHFGNFVSITFIPSIYKNSFVNENRIFITNNSDNHIFFGSDFNTLKDLFIKENYLLDSVEYKQVSANNENYTYPKYNLINQTQISYATYFNENTPYYYLSDNNIKYDNSIDLKKKKLSIDVNLRGSNYFECSFNEANNKIKTKDIQYSKFRLFDDFIISTNYGIDENIDKILINRFSTLNAVDFSGENIFEKNFNEDKIVQDWKEIVLYSPKSKIPHDYIDNSTHSMVPNEIIERLNENFGTTNAGKKIVETKAELLEMSSANNGSMVYVSSERILYVKLGDNWLPLNFNAIKLDGKNRLSFNNENETVLSIEMLNNLLSKGMMKQVDAENNNWVNSKSEIQTISGSNVFDFVKRETNSELKSGSIHLGSDIKPLGENGIGIGNNLNINQKENVIAIGSNLVDSSLSNKQQIILGKFNKAKNISDPNYSFVIGNGTSDENRSNLFAISDEGDIYISGTIRTNREDLINKIITTNGFIDTDSLVTKEELRTKALINSPITYKHQVVDGTEPENNYNHRTVYYVVQSQLESNS